MTIKLTIPKDLADTLFQKKPEINAKIAGMKIINVNFTQMIFDNQAEFVYVWGSLINMCRELWVEDLGRALCEAAFPAPWRAGTAIIKRRSGKKRRIITAPRESDTYGYWHYFAGPNWTMCRRVAITRSRENPNGEPRK